MDNYETYPTPPSNEKKINKNISIVSDGISLLGFVVSVLLLIFYNSQTLHTLFVILCVTTHAIVVMRSVFPQFQIEKDIVQKLLLSSDIHYLTISLIFYMANICPYLYIVIYILLFGVKGYSFVLHNILPLTPYRDELIVDKITQVVTSSTIINLPSYLEILLFFNLIFNAFADFRLMSWVSLIVYAVWLMAFNFVSSEVHSRVWVSISNWLREYAAQNADTFGPQLERAVDAVSEYSKNISRLYPTHELKIHLQ